MELSVRLTTSSGGQRRKRSGQSFQMLKLISPNFYPHLFELREYCKNLLKQWTIADPVSIYSFFFSSKKTSQIKLRNVDFSFLWNSGLISVVLRKIIFMTTVKHLAQNSIRPNKMQASICVCNHFLEIEGDSVFMKHIKRVESRTGCWLIVERSQD